MAKPEVICHIGTGKAGSTAIQQSLNRARKRLLEEEQTKYLGIMLEHLADADKYSWAGDKRAIKQMSRAECGKTLGEAVRDELVMLEKAGVKRVIWSAEAIFEAGRKFGNVLEFLRRVGYPVRVICYIRGPERRISSLFVQQGIRSKIEDEFKTFSEWYYPGRGQLLPKLQYWIDTFGKELELYNFDALKDIVTHFCGQVGIEPLQGVRSNESPADAVLAAAAFYTARAKGPTDPTQFDGVMRSLGVPRGARFDVPTLDRIMPGKEDLEAIREEYAGEVATLNALLTARGEPPLEPRSARTYAQPDPWAFDQLLLQTVLTLNERVEKLERQLAAEKQKKAEPQQRGRKPGPA